MLTAQCDTETLPCSCVTDDRPIVHAECHCNSFIQESEQRKYVFYGVHKSKQQE
jgi:hypothetical protein